MAEWVAIATADGIVLYANPNTIRKSGNKVKMWSLIDFNSAQEAGGEKYFLSTKEQYEYDCKEEQYKALFLSWHSENMGRGDVVHTENIPNKIWAPVAPESISKAKWEFVCGK